MKVLGILLLVLGGVAGIFGLQVIANARAPGVATFVGALAIPALLVWWGTIALGRAKPQLSSPSPETHVKCPDCRELVLKDARKCKHCGCALAPHADL